MNQKESSRQFVIMSVKEFKKNYPESDLEVKNLIPTYPISLERVKLEQKQIAQIKLNPIIVSAVCGMVFGDASLVINACYVNARLQMRHSTRQTEWFMWKSLCILKEFTEDTSICFQKPDGFQRRTMAVGGETLGKWKVLTKVNPELTKLHSIICPQGKKTFQRFWLNHMNNYFLMVLWLDDGSLNGARQGVISLNSTPLDQAKVLVQYMLTVWDIKCEAKIVESKQTQTNESPVAITISDLDNLEKLLRIIAPIVPVKSMLYKVCLYPEDSSRLQRWTSELKTLVRSEWHDDLDKYYAYLGAIR
jgi:hypothetical protein